MGVISLTNDNSKPRAVCIPFPAQGHINPMLKLAKLLHHKGFHITFVNTEFNHQRLLESRGPTALDGLSTFRFETIPDGLPPDATRDIPALCASTGKHCLPHFRNLICRLNTDHDAPPVSCVVSDGVMSFTLDAAEEFGIPVVLFWTPSACGFMGYLHYRQLIEKRYTPLKDESYLTNGYLDAVIDWIPGFKDIRLKDMPTFIRTTDPNDIMLNFVMGEAERARKASAVIFNTFDALEQDVLDQIAVMLPRVYTVGPLQLLLNQVNDDKLKMIGSNLWKEDPVSLEWLNSRERNSVVYVNFGSLTMITPKQFSEFAWGLANSNQAFLWIVKYDLVNGDSAHLLDELVTRTKDRGLFADWCHQEKVLSHPAIGGFLTHCGWNSTIESICSGVPMICWPFFAEQQTNCRYCCSQWGLGMELDSDVKRDEVEKVVRELMEGEKGKKMKKKAMEWKKKAEEVTSSTGSSYLNLEKLIREVLVQN